MAYIIWHVCMFRVLVLVLQIKCKLMSFAQAQVLGERERFARVSIKFLIKEGRDDKKEESFSIKQRKQLLLVGFNRCLISIVVSNVFV